MASIQQAPIKNATSQQDSTKMTLNNATASLMSLGPTQEWYGQVSGGFPITIQPGVPVSFTYTAAPDYSCQAAVVYTGENMAGTPCGWLVAWYAPTNTAAGPNRVYVECGPAANYAESGIDWAAIKNRLMAGSTQSNFTDDVTQATVEAKIDTDTDAAALVVTFGAIA